MSDCVQVNLRITTNSNQGINFYILFFSKYLFIFDYYQQVVESTWVNKNS